MVRDCLLRIVFFNIEAVAFILKELEILLPAAIKNHAHIPRPGEHIGIFDPDLVIDVVGVEESVSFDDMQLFAVEVTRPIKPSLIVEMDIIYH